MANVSPKSLGFSMPAEWEEHKATWLSWPFPHVVWQDRLEATRKEFATFCSSLACYEPVIINVCNLEAEKDAQNRLRNLPGFDNITFHPLNLDDCWFRDNGPIFIKNTQGQVALTDWQFNAWGETYTAWDKDNAAPKSLARHLSMKRFQVDMVLEGGAIEVNGQGTCLTSKSCLLNTNRNPNLDQQSVEDYLQTYLGIKQTLWLEEGFQDDETDGHIDLIARFVSHDHIVCSTTEDKNNPNFLVFSHNLSTLKATNFKVTALPIPEKSKRVKGSFCPLSYANFYIGNAVVIVPTYEDKNDGQALHILQACFPHHHVIGLTASSLITGGGSFHCITQQQPQGEAYAP